MTTQAQLDQALAPFGDCVRQYNWRISSDHYVAFVTNRLSCRSEVADALAPFDKAKLGLPARAPNGFSDFTAVNVSGPMPPNWRYR